MSRRLIFSVGLASAVLSVGCSESPTEVGANACDVANLELNVNQGAVPPVLDWTPRCPVALLLIEPVGGSDAWQIRSANWNDAADAPSQSWNTINPPVTYGVTPAGAESEDYIGPDPLVTGDYTFSLFRVSETGVAVNGVPFTVH